MLLDLSSGALAPADGAETIVLPYLPRPRAFYHSALGSIPVFEEEPEATITILPAPLDRPTPAVLATVFATRWRVTVNVSAPDAYLAVDEELDPQPFTVAERLAPRHARTAAALGYTAETSGGSASLSLSVGGRHAISYAWGGDAPGWVLPLSLSVAGSGGVFPDTYFFSAGAGGTSFPSTGDSPLSCVIAGEEIPLYWSDLPGLDVVELSGSIVLTPVEWAPWR